MVVVQTEMECSRKEDSVEAIVMDQVEVECVSKMVVEHSNVHIHHRHPPQDSVTENLTMEQEMDIHLTQMEVLLVIVDIQDSIKNNKI